MDSNVNLVMENIVHISEVPKFIPIAEKTLRNWRCQGRYPELFIKIGGKVFVDISEIGKLILKQKEDAARNKRRLSLND